MTVRISVIGSGVCGLVAAWVLARRHAVTLFEANTYLGDHSHTVDVTLGDVTHPVDTRFLVFNRETQSNPVRFLFRAASQSGLPTGARRTAGRCA